MEITLVQRGNPSGDGSQGEMQPLPHFLRMQSNCLSETKARSQLIELLKSMGLAKPAAGWEKSVVTFGRERKESASFAELQQELRAKGLVLRIQRELDRDDSIYARMLEASATPNSNIKIASSWAGWTREITGPGRLANVEAELCDDIFHYRTEACDRSNEAGFVETCRAYRGYLSACISIIEAFVGRHVLLAGHSGFTSPEFEELKKTTNLERRLELWWAFCVGNDFRKLTATAEWNHFQDLRQRRNALLHAADPVSVYELREMQTYLNKVRTGVGGLLLKMRLAHQKRTLTFIERLRTAPLVDFHEAILKGNGPHHTKVRQGRDRA